MWRLGIVTELETGRDNHIRGALVRIPKTNSVLKRPVSKLYPIECCSQKDENNREEIERTRPRREAAVFGELKRQYTT